MVFLLPFTLRVHDFRCCGLVCAFDTVGATSEHDEAGGFLLDSDFSCQLEEVHVDYIHISSRFYP